MPIDTIFFIPLNKSMVLVHHIPGFFFCQIDLLRSGLAVSSPENRCKIIKNSNSDSPTHHGDSPTRRIARPVVNSLEHIPHSVKIRWIGKRTPGSGSNLSLSIRNSRNFSEGACRHNMDDWSVSNHGSGQDTDKVGARRRIRLCFHKHIHKSLMY